MDAAAAQGMNTGIIDAVNLGWMLAYADPERPALLDSYDHERRPAARQARLHDPHGPPGVHLLLAREAEPVEPAHLGPRVIVHRIDSWPGTGITAVSPDGHVGHRSARGAHALTDWLELVGAAL